jgi:hypothetical protein
VRDIAQESLVLGLLPNHPRLLAKRGIYYERGDSWFSSSDNEDDVRYGLPVRPERVVFIIQPFARLTLAELLAQLSPALELLLSIKYWKVSMLCTVQSLIHLSIEI